MKLTTIINKIKKETNNISDIVYREKKVNKETIYIIYNEPLISSESISNFIIRSLNHLKSINDIENNISNFKYQILKNYDDIVFYLHRGFTIILTSKSYYALETKNKNMRSINTPTSENTVRGSKDAFVEDYQTNISLIKKRIKSNDLWIDTSYIGKYTNTQVSIIYINKIVKKKLVNIIKKRLKKLNIDGILTSDTVKKMIEQNNNTTLPITITTERPDLACNALLEGKLIIVVDNSPYILIVPGLLVDYFKTTEDVYGNYKNVTFTRIIKYIAFFISLLAPSLYIALVTYNQEMLPTDLIINFAIQRDGVPFPVFFEALIMVLAFEILRESDLRVPSFSGSALSIVGALILGEAAVNAGLVSPIMIIIIAITSISSLLFTEFDLINGIRWYRILFMLGSAFLGILGLILVLLYFIINIVSINAYTIPYLTPIVPTYINGLKDSIIKLPFKKLTKRNKYLSENRIRKDLS